MAASTHSQGCPRITTPCRQRGKCDPRVSRGLMWRFDKEQGRTERGGGWQEASGYASLVLK